jgi:hypothetical protein
MFLSFSFLRFTFFFGMNLNSPVKIFFGGAGYTQRRKGQNDRVTFLFLKQRNTEKTKTNHLSELQLFRSSDNQIIG